MILGNRLGREHAQLLAARRSIAATADRLVRRAARAQSASSADLADAERGPIETLRRQLLAEIGELARENEAGGRVRRLVAHMLEIRDDHAHRRHGVCLCGARPVLVLWGHASEGQAVPEPPVCCRPRSRCPARVALRTPCRRSAGACAPAGPRRHSAAAIDTVAVMGAPARRGWLAWLLPLLLLLLLALLVWRALQPLPPIVVERQAPAPPPPADRSRPNKTGEGTAR